MPTTAESFHAGWDACFKLLGGDETRHRVHVTTESWAIEHPLLCRLQSPGGLRDCPYSHITQLDVQPPEGMSYVVRNENGHFTLQPAT